jgi:tRNA(adenine34) deaminase
MNDGSLEKSNIDEHFMGLAIEQAKLAEALEEVPIGCIIAEGGRVIAAEFNRREIDHDPLAHAEILAIRKASEVLGRWRLSGCAMYVTLEPCVMCSGAIVLSRLDRVVYGASDAKAGAVESLYRILGDERLNHRPPTTGGVLGDRCAEMLSEFFRRKRKNGSL